MATFQHWTAAEASQRLPLATSGAIGYDPASGARVFVPRSMTGFEKTVGFQVAIPNPQKQGSYLVIGRVRTRPENEEGAIKLATKRFSEMYHRYLQKFVPPTM